MADSAGSGLDYYTKLNLDLSKLVGGRDRASVK